MHMMTTANPSARGQFLLDRGASLPLILPATLLVLVFLVGPFYYMVYTAMTDLSFANPDQKGAFIGFDNFRKLMRDDTIFWGSFWLHHPLRRWSPWRSNSCSASRLPG